MQPDDLSLIEAYLAHEPRAFEHLVERYSTPIYNFVYRLCGNSDEAYDITQEIFVKVWKNIKKYNKKNKFSTWIYSIARNTTIDWLRKKHAVLFSQLNSSTDDEAESFENNLIDTEPLAPELFARQELSLVLQKALEQLTLDQRTVITLRHINELSFKEIADILSLSINTVQSQYRRGIIQLRKDPNIARI